jgi:hypothetical protein
VQKFCTFFLQNLLALRLQEREALSEQQRVKSIQQGKKCEEESDFYVDNKKDKLRLHKVTEDVSAVCLWCSSKDLEL